MHGHESKVRLKMNSNAYRLALLTAMVIVWQIISIFLGRMFLPSPIGVAAAAVELLSNGILIGATLNSLAILFVGFFLAVAIAIPLGLIMGGFRRIGEALDIYINAFNSMPRIALIPLIIVWFGLGFNAKVVVVILSAFFPIIVNTYAGISNADKDLIEAGRSFGARDKDLFIRIMLPASIPFLITGLRLGAARGIMGIIMAEFFTAVSGLGGLIITYGNTFQMERLFVAVLVLVVMGGTQSELLKRFEKFIAPWKATELQV